MTAKHTPGPWYADKFGDIWRRHPAELYENGGGIAGDKPIAQARIGWRGIEQQGYPVEQNARLIAAAPDLLEALKHIINTLVLNDEEGLIEHSEQIINARAAIAKATGESP